MLDSLLRFGIIADKRVVLVVFAMYDAGKIDSGNYG